MDQQTHSTPATVARNILIAALLLVVLGGLTAFTQYGRTVLPIAALSPQVATAVHVPVEGTAKVVVYDAAIPGVGKEVSDASDRSLLLWRYRAVDSSGGVFISDTNGVVYMPRNGTAKTVVQFAGAARAQSPIAVSRQGDLLAVASTIDNSLQVYRNLQGSYVPIALEKVGPVTSIGFTQDSSAILLTALTEDGGSTVRSFNLEQKRVAELGSTRGDIYFINK